MHPGNKHTAVLVLLVLCASISHSGKVIQVKTTGDQTKSVYLNDKGVEVIGQKTLIMDIKACAEAVIQFAQTQHLNGGYYEVYLGSRDNSMSMVRFSGQKKKESVRGSPLDCKAFKTFWFSWEDSGTLHVGSGSIIGVREFLSLEIEERVEIHYIIVYTALGNEGEWRVLKDSRPEFVHPNRDGSTVIEVREDTPAHAAIYELKAHDPDEDDVTYHVIGQHSDVFGISSTKLKILKRLDYEEKQSYVVTISATDGKHEVRQSMMVIVVDLVDEVPVIGPPIMQTILEELPVGTPIGQLANVVDRDRGAKLKYTLRGRDSQYFNMDPNTGEVRMRKRLDRDKRNGRRVLDKLILTVDDHIHLQEKKLSVGVIDINDNPPMFGNTIYRVSVKENLLRDTIIANLSCVDIDDGANSIFSLVVSSVDVHGSNKLPEKEQTNNGGGGHLNIDVPRSSMTPPITKGDNPDDHDAVRPTIPAPTETEIDANRRERIPNKHEDDIGNIMDNLFKTKKTASMFDDTDKGDSVGRNARSTNYNQAYYPHNDGRYSDPSYSSSNTFDSQARQGSRYGAPIHQQGGYQQPKDSQQYNKYPKNNIYPETDRNVESKYSQTNRFDNNNRRSYVQADAKDRYFEQERQTRPDQQDQNKYKWDRISKSRYAGGFPPQGGDSREHFNDDQYKNYEQENDRQIKDSSNLKQRRRDQRRQRKRPRRFDYYDYDYDYDYPRQWRRRRNMRRGQKELHGSSWLHDRYSNFRRKSVPSSWSELLEDKEPYLGPRGGERVGRLEDYLKPVQKKGQNLVEPEKPKPSNVITKQDQVKITTSTTTTTTTTTTVATTTSTTTTTKAPESTTRGDDMDTINKELGNINLPDASVDLEGLGGTDKNNSSDYGGLHPIKASILDDYDPFGADYGDETTSSPTTEIPAQNPNSTMSSNTTQNSTDIDELDDLDDLDDDDDDLDDLDGEDDLDLDGEDDLDLDGEDGLDDLDDEDDLDNLDDDDDDDLGDEDGEDDLDDVDDKDDLDSNDLDDDKDDLDSNNLDEEKDDLDDNNLDDDKNDLDGNNQDDDNDDLDGNDQDDDNDDLDGNDLSDDKDNLDGDDDDDVNNLDDKDAGGKADKTDGTDNDKDDDVSDDYDLKAPSPSTLLSRKKRSFKTIFGKQLRKYMKEKNRKKKKMVRQALKAIGRMVWAARRRKEGRQRQREKWERIAEAILKEAGIHDHETYVDQYTAKDGREMKADGYPYNTEGYRHDNELPTYQEERIDANNYDVFQKQRGGMDRELSGMDRELSGMDRHLSGMDRQFSGIDRQLSGMHRQQNGKGSHLFNRKDQNFPSLYDDSKNRYQGQISNRINVMKPHFEPIQEDKTDMDYKIFDFGNSLGGRLAQSDSRYFAPHGLATNTNKQYRPNAQVIQNSFGYQQLKYPKLEKPLHEYIPDFLPNLQRNDGWQDGPSQRHLSKTRPIPSYHKEPLWKDFGYSSFWEKVPDYRHPQNQYPFQRPYAENRYGWNPRRPFRKTRPRHYQRQRQPSFEEYLETSRNFFNGADRPYDNSNPFAESPQIEQVPKVSSSSGKTYSSNSDESLNRYSNGIGYKNGGMFDQVNFDNSLENTFGANRPDEQEAELDFKEPKKPVIPESRRRVYEQLGLDIPEYDDYDNVDQSETKSQSLQSTIPWGGESEYSDFDQDQNHIDGSDDFGSKQDRYNKFMQGELKENEFREPNSFDDEENGHIYDANRVNPEKESYVSLPLSELLKLHINTNTKADKIPMNDFVLVPKVSVEENIEEALREGPSVQENVNKRDKEYRPSQKRTTDAKYESKEKLIKRLADLMEEDETVEAARRSHFPSLPSYDPESSESRLPSKRDPRIYYHYLVKGTRSQKPPRKPIPYRPRFKDPRPHYRPPSSFRSSNLRKVLKARLAQQALSPLAVSERRVHNVPKWNFNRNPNTIIQKQNHKLSPFRYHVKEKPRVSASPRRQIRYRKPPRRYPRFKRNEEYLAMLSSLNIHNLPKRDTAQHRRPMFEARGLSIVANGKSVDYDSMGEGDHTFTLTVLAIDKPEYGSPQTGTTMVLVEVLPVNEFVPEWSSPQVNATGWFPSILVPENVTVGTKVASLLATDKDGGEDGRVTYTLVRVLAADGEDAMEFFTISPSTGELKTAAVMDRDPNTGGVTHFDLTIRASDNGKPSFSSKGMLRVILTDVNDNPPVFGKLLYEAILPSSWNKLSAWKLQLDVRDHDRKADFKFRIYKGDSQKFLIDEKTGVLSLSGTPDKTLPYKVLTILVTDGGTPELNSTTQVIVHTQKYSFEQVKAAIDAQTKTEGPWVFKMLSGVFGFVLLFLVIFYVCKKYGMLSSMVRPEGEKAEDEVSVHDGRRSRVINIAPPPDVTNRGDNSGIESIHPHVLTQAHLANRKGRSKSFGIMQGQHIDVRSGGVQVHGGVTSLQSVEETQEGHPQESISSMRKAHRY